MSKFAEKLRTKGKVEEDLYFAKRDRELLRAMKKEKLAKALDVGGRKKKRACDDLERDFTKASKRHSNRLDKLVKSYRKLLKRAKKLGD
jgi:hypothetical protein